MTAIDYSAVSVEPAGKRNAEQIRAGRCRVLQAEVSDLPFNSNRFHLATAFETVYFWPGPLKSFQEVYRVLKPHAAFLIVNECDGENEKDRKWMDLVDGMTVYRETELVGYLKDAGFAEVEVFPIPPGTGSPFLPGKHKESGSENSFRLIPQAARLIVLVLAIRRSSSII